MSIGKVQICYFTDVEENCVLQELLLGSGRIATMRFGYGSPNSRRVLLDVAWTGDFDWVNMLHKARIFGKYKTFTEVKKK